MLFQQRRDRLKWTRRGAQATLAVKDVLEETTPSDAAAAKFNIPTSPLVAVWYLRKGAIEYNLTATDFDEYTLITLPGMFISNTSVPLYTNGRIECFTPLTPLYHLPADLHCHRIMLRRSPSPTSPGRPAPPIPFPASEQGEKRSGLSYAFRPFTDHRKINSYGCSRLPKVKNLGCTGNNHIRYLSPPKR